MQYILSGKQLIAVNCKPSTSLADEIVALEIMKPTNGLRRICESGVCHPMRVHGLEKNPSICQLLNEVPFGAAFFAPVSLDKNATVIECMFGKTTVMTATNKRKLGLWFGGAFSRG